jgi:hypothetical protein
MRACAALIVLAGALPAQTVLRGTVRDMTGVPVSGVQVHAQMDGTAINLGRVSQVRGEFFFTLLPGAYSVTTDRGPDKHHIEIAAGEEAVLDLAVPASPTISGRVLDEDRQPLKGVLVRLLIPEYRHGFLQYNQQRAVTDAKGAYSFNERVESNRRYYMVAARPGNGQSPPDVAMEDRQPIEVPTYYPSSPQFDAASPIVLQPSEQRTAVDIKLTTAPYYCVDGKIRDQEFTIEETTADIPKARGRAGQNGIYRSCGLPAGSYRLVTADGGVEFTVANADVHGVDLSSPPAHLRLQSDWEPPTAAGGAAEISDVEESLARSRLADRAGIALDKILHSAQPFTSASTRGDVLLPGPLPIGGVALAGTSFGRDVLLRPSQAETEVPAGEYAVVTNLPGGGEAAIWYNGIKLLDPVLRVMPGVSGTLRVAAPPPNGALSVSIADGADATVIVVPDYVASAEQLARLAIHGGNEFKLPPGRYRVLATAQAIRWRVPDDLEKLLPAMWQGQLVDLEEKTPVQITVKPVTIY